MAAGIVKDIPLLVRSAASSSERRITPTWSISQLKQKLEPVTGIPPSAQTLILRLPDQDRSHNIQAEHEDTVQIGRWPLVAYAELEVNSTTPPAVPVLATLDPSSVPKADISKAQYAQKPGTVLDYKRCHKIGRFDPNAPEKEREKVAATWRAASSRGIEPGHRCALVGQENSRRGVVAYVGTVDELPGLEGGAWVGIVLDEPVGRNDGSIERPRRSDGAAKEGSGEAAKDGSLEVTTEDREGKRGQADRKRYFQCGHNHGVFVRPERVVVDDRYAELRIEDDLGSEMEEI